MKTISSWRDLQPYGIDLLTGEACGLSYRLLCDVTEQGRRIIGKCLGIPNMVLPESWNRGTAETPHVGCIMLTREMLEPLAVFALLESGCKEVYLVKGSVVGVEPSDEADAIDVVKRIAGVDYARRLAYQGTAGDRNVHVMSGRVE
jgi:hypothetical protein